MKKKGCLWLVGLLLICVLVMTGCSLLNHDKIKLRDLEFTILSDEKVPEELKKLIEEKKKEAFQFTFTDGDNLYICVGYGEQQTGGYSIAVEELYLTEANICTKTTLIGPKTNEKQQQVQSYPYIVIKTEALEQPVLFE